MNNPKEENLITFSFVFFSYDLGQKMWHVILPLTRDDVT
jgi:hypothetical protein